MRTVMKRDVHMESIHAHTHTTVEGKMKVGTGTLVRENGSGNA